MSKDGGQCTIEQMSHILPQSSPSRPRMDMSPPYNREGDSPGSRGVDSEAQNRRTFSELEWQSEIPERIEDASKPGIKMSDPPTPSFTSSRSPPERERETDVHSNSLYTSRRVSSVPVVGSSSSLLTSTMDVNVCPSNVFTIHLSIIPFLPPFDEKYCHQLFSGC